MKKYLWLKWFNFRHSTGLGLKFGKLLSWLGLRLMKFSRVLIKHGFGHCSVCGEKNNMNQAAGRHGTRCMKSPKPCWENNVFEVKEK